MRTIRPKFARRIDRRTGFIEPLENRTLLAAGQLDPSFSGDGKATADFHTGGMEARAVAVQADGKTVVVGVTQDIQGNSVVGQDFAVARFNFDGSLDTSFGGGTGRVRKHVEGTANRNGANAVVIQPDGKILVAGSRFDSAEGAAGAINSEMIVMRFRSNGALDHTFDGDGIAAVDFGHLSFSGCRAMTLQKDGKIVLAGSRLNSLGLTDPKFAIARLNSNGSTDDSFNGDGTQTVGFDGDAFAKAVTIDYSGSASNNPFFGGIVVSGFVNKDDVESFALARIKPNGDVDNRFDGDGALIASVPQNNLTESTGVVVQPSGKIVASGFSGMDGAHNDVFAIARFKRTGGLDTTFAGGKGWAMIGFGGDDVASSIIQGQNNRLIVGGRAGNQMAIACLTADGVLDKSFGTSGKLTLGGGVANGMAYGPGNRFVTAGGSNFNTARFYDIDGGEVGAAAIATTASEQGPAPISFLVTRTERLPVTTRVFFTIGGTATSPTLFTLRNHTNDYTLGGLTIPVAAVIGGDTTPFVDIAANQTFTLVTLTPVDDTIKESTETASFTIKAKNSYIIGSPSSATINIKDNDNSAFLPLNPTADAYVRDGTSAGTNFGTAPELQVKKGGSGFNRVSYIKFDLSSVGTITSAQLQVLTRLSDTQNASIDTSVFSVADTSWSETGINFNNAPAAGATPLATTKITGAGGDIYIWDVSSYVKAQKAAGHNIVSFAFKNLASTSSFVIMNSREAAQQRPLLIVEATASSSTGTFKIATEHSHVTVGQSNNVAVTWQVPSGGWRQLHDIELRLRGDDGSLIIIDWNEAANTFALFNPHTGKFRTPGVLGSNGVLSNNLIDVLLQKSSTKAAGPTSPVVKVNFNLRFHHSAAAAHHFALEAQATNDVGFKTTFVRGGGLNVA